MDLIQAESEIEVTEILENNGFLGDEENWQNYGDVPTNFGSVSDCVEFPV